MGNIVADLYFDPGKNKLIIYFISPDLENNSLAGTLNTTLKEANENNNTINKKLF